MTSSHDYKKDRRNDKIKIFVNGKFLDRNNAKISVFDSGFLLGDGVWSGIRLHNGKLLFLTEHLQRLYDDAKAISLKIHVDKKELTKKPLRLTFLKRLGDLDEGLDDYTLKK